MLNASPSSAPSHAADTLTNAQARALRELILDLRDELATCTTAAQVRCVKQSLAAAESRLSSR